MTVSAALTPAAEILHATGGHPFARSALRDPEVVSWQAEGAVVWHALSSDGPPRLTTFGTPEAVASLVAGLLSDFPDGAGLTLPRGTTSVLPAELGFEGVDWDFWWYDEPPAPRTGEDRVVVVADEEVGPLLAFASPTASAQPGDSRVRRWLGVRQGDGLLACAADTSAVDGVGHVSSVAVHPDARGQGLGAAVTAQLSRRMFAEGADLVTLGMYADNTPGRALYRSLGMKEYLVTSGRLCLDVKTLS